MVFLLTYMTVVIETMNVLPITYIYMYQVDDCLPNINEL